MVFSVNDGSAYFSFFFMKSHSLPLLLLANRASANAPLSFLPSRTKANPAYPRRRRLGMFDRDDLLLEGLHEVVRQEGIDTATLTGGISSLQRVHLHTITTTAVQPVDKYWLTAGYL